VRKAFQNDGFSFLLKVFNELNYLEDLTGLRAMQLATDLSEVILKLYKNEIFFFLNSFSDNRIE
jgi:hypothetical protein